MELGPEACPVRTPSVGLNLENRKAVSCPSLLPKEISPDEKPQSPCVQASCACVHVCAHTHTHKCYRQAAQWLNEWMNEHTNIHAHWPSHITESQLIPTHTLKGNIQSCIQHLTLTCLHNSILSQHITHLHTNVHFFYRGIYYLLLFLAMLGLCCCTGFSRVVASRGYFVVVVHRLLIAVASLAAEHGL